MAADIYLGAIATAIALIVTAVLLDIGLVVRGDPTVSAMLRQHPMLFWWPAGIVVAGLAALAAHLFWLYE